MKQEQQRRVSILEKLSSGFVLKIVDRFSHSVVPIEEVNQIESPNKSDEDDESNDSESSEVIPEEAILPISKSIERRKNAHFGNFQYIPFDLSSSFKLFSQHSDKPQQGVDAAALSNENKPSSLQSQLNDHKRRNSSFEIQMARLTTRTSNIFSSLKSGEKTDSARMKTEIFNENEEENDSDSHIDGSESNSDNESEHSTGKSPATTSTPISEKRRNGFFSTPLAVGSAISSSSGILGGALSSLFSSTSIGMKKKVQGVSPQTTSEGRVLTAEEVVERKRLHQVQIDRQLKVRT